MNRTLRFLLAGINFVSDSLTVQACTPLLNTSDATVSTLVDQTFVENLPLTGRNFTFLAPVFAGVIQGQQKMRRLGASGSFAANGLRPVQIGRVSASGKSPTDGILSDTDARITASALLQCYISAIGAA